MKEELIRVDAPFMRAAPCFFLIAYNGRITEAPPIAWWTRGKKKEIVVDWYKNHRAIVTTNAVGHQERDK